MTSSHFLRNTFSENPHKYLVLCHGRFGQLVLGISRFAVGVILMVITLTNGAAAQMTVTPPAPTPQSVNAGANLTFTVNVSGQAGAPTYIWQVSPSPNFPTYVSLSDGGQTSGSTISGSSSATLQITNTQTGDSGKYRCLVTDSTGTLNSGPGSLTVTLPPPPTVTQPSSQTVVAGNAASFAVTASGQGPFTYFWQFSSNGGTFGTLSDGGRISGSSTATLQIANVQASDAGNYRCLVSNAGGQVNSGPATLTVSPPPPPSVTPPGSETVVAGNAASFAVTASGQGPFTYFWQFSSNGGTFGTLSDGGRISGSSTATLQITNVQASDAGRYRCLVSNAGGQVNSGPATLTVNLPPPPTVTSPGNQTVLAGQNAGFSVAASGQGPLTYAWQFSSNGGSFTSLSDGGRISGSSTSTLQIANVQASDAGQYLCLVSNAGGTTNCTSATQTVLASPPANLTATSVFSRTINLSWTNTDPNAQQVVIERQTLAPGTPTSFGLLVEASSQLTSYQDQSASPLTTYNYRAYAMYSSDSLNSPHAYSNAVSAKTPSAPCAPTNLAYHFPRPQDPNPTTEIDLTWQNPVKPDSNTGICNGVLDASQAIVVERQAVTTGAGTPFVPIACFGINTPYYTKNQITCAGDAGTQSYADTNGGAGLPTQTAFNYRVYAIASTGEKSPSSNMVQTTTNSAPPTPQPFQATPASTTEIDLSWNTSDPTVTEFVISQQDATGMYRQLVDLKKSDLDPTAFYQRFYRNVGLTPGTQYNYQIVAKSPTGTSTPPVSASATTFPAPPPAQACKDHADPAGPICVDFHNNRYFNLNGTPMVLVGASGEYIPHVDTQGLKFFCDPNNSTNPIPCVNNPTGSTISTAYCTHATVPSDTTSKIKAYRCIDQLNTDHLNHMRLWVSLNSSPGTDKTQDPRVVQPHPFPYLDEQPFTFSTSNNQWNLSVDSTPTLTNADNTFFANLKDVVTYAGSKGVIVEVTLFDPWSSRGKDGTASPYSSYLSTNQSQPKKQFTDNHYFVETELNCPPSSSNVDCTDANIQMRNVQIALLKQVVTTLYSADNVYYELANEADFNNYDSAETNVLAWHNLMATIIRSTETSMGNRQHLIAVNVAGPNAIVATLHGTSGPVSVVNGHYVHIQPSSKLPSSSVSAIDLIQNYNVYNPVDTMIWGFNESRIPGYDFPDRTTEGIRAEAWEFLLAGGGVYDLLAYDWGNWNQSGVADCPGSGVQPQSPNNCTSTEAIIQLGMLSDFLKGQTDPAGQPNLVTLKRGLFNGQTWISNLPGYGSQSGQNSNANVYFSGIYNNTDIWLLYIHHSKLSSHPLFQQYDPQCLPNCSATFGNGGYSETFTVSNLAGCSSGQYEADWYDPSSNLSSPYAYQKFPWSTGANYGLNTSPQYPFDILLKIRLLHCDTAKLSVSNSGTGGGVVTSDSGGISCGSTCSADFATGTVVTLSPQPSAGSVFAGWPGQCPGTGPCSVPVSGNTSVTAAFNLIPTVATPSLNPPAGTYAGAQTVVLTDATSGAVIHYTTDGSTPTALSPSPGGPITISSTTTVKALATAAGFNNSNMASAIYTILIPDFSVSATPTSQNVLGCGNASYTVSVSALNGFSGNVALSVNGLPAGATASFSPAAISGAGSSTLTVATATSTPTGNYVLTITGTSGSLAHTTSVTLVVQDFSGSVTPTSQTITAGGSTSYAASVSAVNGFSGSVALSVTGVPTGATASFSPASISAAGSSTLTVTTTSSTPAGTYSLPLTGTSGCRMHSGPITLVVNSANPAPSISSLSITAGPVGTSITISGANFGATQGSNTVSFNGTAGKPASWASSSISVPVPLGATTGNVAVKVGTQSSNGMAFTVQDDALHTFAVNCSNCGSQVTDFTIQSSPLYGYVIQSGDTLYFYQKQSAGSVAGITFCFPGGDVTVCNDDGRTVDQNGQPVYADTVQGVTHFRKVDLTPSAGQAINQIIFHSTGQTQAGRWDVYYSDVEIVSANGTVRPIFTTGSTLSLFPYSSAGVTQQGFAIEHNHVW